MKKFCAGRRLFDGVPATHFGRWLFVDMSDIGVALETIVAVRFHHALVNDQLHVAAWTAEGLQGVAATAGDVVVLRQIRLESAAQRRTALFPLFFRRDSLFRLAPEILGPAVGLEQEQLYIFYCVGMPAS